MFIDEIELILKAGDGGRGIVSFFPGKKSGPDGGNGGDGGNVYVKASSNISQLSQFTGKHKLSAENGKSGDSNNKTGANGKDLEIDLPMGTLLLDQESDRRYELLEENQRVLVCRGGSGGKGNSEFKSAIITTPRFAEQGEEGEEKRFKIIVRMIADFGLIGLPNAGKSSLLNELTNTSVRVADYPFTTVQPNLGVLKGKVIADIPGLIEGASKGKGLGVSFLKHIEKVGLLIHCISSESEEIIKDYKAVMKELREYNPELADKKQIVLLTKSDLLDQKEIDKRIKKLKKLQLDVLAVSIIDSESLEKLANLIKSS